MTESIATAARTQDVSLLTAAVLANPRDNQVRLVLADAIAETTGDYPAASEYGRSLQATVENTVVVTVGRDGAARAAVGGMSFPIRCTKVYRAVRRRDGVLTWQLVRRLGDGTAGNGVSGPMVARARNHAEEIGAAYVPGVTHGQRCD
jgi:hypothetical protein